MLRALVAGTLAAALGCMVGLAIGERHGLIQGMRHLETDVAGSLTSDVEVASCVRNGDTERALRLLEGRVDGGVLRLTDAKSDVGLLAAQMSMSPEEALGLAKAYRSVVPASGGNAASVESALKGVLLPALKKPLGLDALVKRVGQ